MSGQPSAVFQGPTVISRGGEYRGRWRSLDAATPAVTIKTTEPVTIVGSVIESRGPLIQSAVGHTRITVRDTTGRGLNPNVAGRCPGRFLSAEGFDSVEVRNNLIEGTSGIYLLEYRGSPPASTKAKRQAGKAVVATVVVVGNRVRNVDGRRSDGRGGYLDFNDRRRAGERRAESGYDVVQFLQLDKVRNVPGMEVAWNEVVNEPGLSRVEDNINIYLSSGTSESPLRIHDNYVQGAFTVRPWQADTRDSDWEYDWSYSGGGILLGDGSSPSADGASSHVRAERNQVVSTTNYGVAVSSGHDLEFAHNRVLSCGRLPDGRAIAGQNVGAYIWDADGGKKSGSFFNNRAHDNLLGWVGKEGKRNDWWIPDAASWENNTHWEDPITPETEAAELALWWKKVAKAGITIGPVPSQAPVGSVRKSSRR